ncbi:Poly(ADP-ribose) polymerase pme-5, partial [Orchesella cincta]
MVRIRARQVKVPDLLSSPLPQPARKRKIGDNSINSHSTVSPASANGNNNASIRASKRSRTTHLPYQSPESLEALITVAGRRKKPAELQETPRSKVSRAPKKPEKPVKRLKKQASNTKQTTPKQSVRRKLLATPEPPKSTVKAVSSLTKAKKKVVKAKKALIKPTKQKAATPRVAVRKRKNAKDETDVDKPVSDKGKKTPKAKKRKGKLNPKPELTNYEKDPTFESRLEIPFVSTLAHSRLLIRAVILKDLKLLKKLIHEEPQKIYTLAMQRSAFVEENVLHYIVKTENKDAFKLLFEVPTKLFEKFGPSPSLLITREHTGHGSHRMFGHALRQVSVGRGGKEGNDAFLYDLNAYNYSTTPSYRQESIRIALQTGASQSFIDFLLEKQQLQDWDYTEIHLTIRKGHHLLAGKAITKAFERGGYGFNFLHGEALTKTTSSSLTPFKPVSVVKKCTYDPRFTPLHCAAINPNIEIITALLRSMPDYNLADGQGWTVGHYASVCSSPEPLKYLLQFGISVHAVTSTKRNGDGYTLLHAAISAGRTHNVKVI